MSASEAFITSQLLEPATGSEDCEMISEGAAGIQSTGTNASASSLSMEAEEISKRPIYDRDTQSTFVTVPQGNGTNNISAPHVDASGSNGGVVKEADKTTTNNNQTAFDDTDAGETDHEDEDMVSELSVGSDLEEELEAALSDHYISFKGSFYHSTLLAVAPNPCLSISGLGLVGLPLSERDAKAIILCSTLAPFGRGERTVVDKDVRDTWEIEPSRISFANQQWLHYISNTVCTEVCKSLGVTVGNSPPKMELYKLLLYEKGSHFLPHQDTQKAEGMFATVIIILPSAYTGGQVVVSHASDTKVIDYSQESLVSSALLAWYTDVKHEVKEVTSGYRLALSYNLIHVAPSGAPLPGPPNMSQSGIVLRRVLKKWRAGKYDHETNRDLMAYLLDHQYSTANLQSGLKALKGADMQRVNFLRPIAEELGFMVGLAGVEHQVSGPADDCGGGYHSRRRYYYSSDDDGDDDGETPEMVEVTNTSTNITGLVDMDGNNLLSIGKIDVGDDGLIPKFAFDNETPDDIEYEGYMGNYAGDVEHWYRRTVLVIMREDRLDDICYSFEGIPYAFRKLKQSSTIPPTTEDRQWAHRLIQKNGAVNKDHIVTLMDYAYKWHDLAMWKSIMKNTSCSLKTIDVDLLFKAWSLFSFEAVRVSFEEILARSTQLAERTTFIYQLQPNASAEEKNVVHGWCRKELDKVLASYTSATVQDIPTILTIIREAGLKSFRNIVVPNLMKKKDNYDFWISFIKSLREGRQGILDREAERHLPGPVIADSQTTTDAPVPTDSAPDKNLVDKLINECLQAAASQWSDASPQQTGYPYYSGYHNAQNSTTRRMTRVDRVIEIIEQAIEISDLNICRALFIELLKAPGTIPIKFSELYNPLIPRLRTLLSSKNLDLCTSPFVDLMQVLIGTYLKDILGKKGHLHNSRLRKVGCGCGDCGPLDKFILDPTTSKTVFRLAQARRTHLERQLANARDLCTYVTIRSGSPHGVQVTKLPEIVQASMWGSRQKAANTFLASIGPENIIARIMGARYPEINQAITGALSFGSARTVLPSVPLTTGTRVPTTTISSTSSSTVDGAANSSQGTGSSDLNPVTPHVAGTKRKNGPNVVQLGPIIDLTSP